MENIIQLLDSMISMNLNSQAQEINTLKECVLNMSLQRITSVHLESI